MSRLSHLLLLLAVTPPLAAHDGMALDGAVHRFLHEVGTANVIAAGGLAVFALAAWLLRRHLRRATPARREGETG